MAIDVPTLLLLLTAICGTTGLVFLAGWRGKGGSELELRVACAMLLMGAGAGLILMRGTIPDRISIDVANAANALGLGYVWSIARTFGRARAPIWIVVAGAVVWLIACAFPAFHDELSYRVALISAITATYAAAAGWEFLRPNAESERSRRLIAILCIVHAAFTTGRGLWWLFGPAGDSVLAPDGWRAAMMVEPLLAVTLFAVLMMALVRGRSEHILRRTAETDALTGVLNRRAFLAQAQKALDDAQRQGQPATLLLFDLDHFKSINDRFGHAVGDATLCIFAHVVSKAIRANDLFGRIGGEEFAAVLVGARSDTAQRIGDRVRVEFSDAILNNDVSVTATVSVGVAEVPDDRLTPLDELMAQADAALYEAKRAGRNRVVNSLAIAS